MSFRSFNTGMQSTMKIPLFNLYVQTHTPLSHEVGQTKFTNFENCAEVMGWALCEGEMN